MKTDRLLTKLTNVLEESSSKQIKIAYIKAESAHKSQLNFTGEPYIQHPLRVSIILAEELNIKDSDTLVTAILHDVLENSDTTIQEIENIFNSKIANALKILTKPKDFFVSLDSQKLFYKKLNQAQKYIQIVKLADKLDNLRNLDRYNDKLEKRKYLLDASFNYLDFSKKINPYIAGHIEDLIFKYKSKWGDFRY